jgi:TniQ
MHTVSISDACWQTTFPHLVTPFDDEWLPGLLLRCDEANHWESRTTLTYLLAPGPEKFHRCWRTETPNLIVIQSSALKLNALAQCLALPTNMLFATTYHMELARLYSTLRPHPRFLSESFTFHLCPACIAEARLLRRSSILPHITICQQHHIRLVQRCLCGAPLRLFHQQTLPFICSDCRRDWAEFPRIEATPTDLEREQRFLNWYAFFFSKDAPPLTREVLQLLAGSILKRSLGSLTALLVKEGRSPDMLS